MNVDNYLSRFFCFVYVDETQVNIAKHVLKSLCTDVTNILVNSLAADLMMSVENPSTITNEVRGPPPMVSFFFFFFNALSNLLLLLTWLCRLRSEWRFWANCQKKPKDLLWSCTTAWTEKWVKPSLGDFCAIDGNVFFHFLFNSRQLKTLWPTWSFRQRFADSCWKKETKRKRGTCYHKSDDWSFMGEKKSKFWNKNF